MNSCLRRRYRRAAILLSVALALGAVVRAYEPVSPAAQVLAEEAGGSTPAAPGATANAKSGDATQVAERAAGPIADFQLVASDNTQFRLSEVKARVVVLAFVGVDCPLANLYLSRLQELSDLFHKEQASVQVVAVNSNAADLLPELREQARRLQLSIPLLKDPAGEVADLLGARRTPQAFVLDEQRQVCYSGRIDDQYGYTYRRTAPTQTPVVNAVRALLAGETVAAASTEVEGCIIARRRTSAQAGPVTYHRDVAPIVQRRCQQCHREGEIAPFELQTYDDAVQWSDTIKEVVEQRRMPPWLADAPAGRFANDCSLSDDERRTVVAWVEAGTPAGDPADAPAPREWPTGWNIGTPDAVYEMPASFHVPAKGVVPYQHVVMTEIFDEDRWVQAVECRPGNRAVVHHILALLHSPGNRKTSQNGLDRGFFAAAAPGSSFMIFPEGQAKRIPKGSQIVFQVHYTPCGTEVDDRSSLGLIFAKEPPLQEVHTYGLADPRIRIPAGAADHVHSLTLKLPDDVELCTLFPHLHVRGKSFEYRVEYPDGRKEVLLSVPRWDFHWQLHYRFQEPVRLPRGTKLTITAHWDNSEKNPNNFLPLKDVRWGDQTWDEMFIGYADYVRPIK